MEEIWQVPIVLTQIHRKMNRTLIIILTIIVLSAIGVLIGYYLLDWGLRKSLLIFCGAGAAMIFFDVVMARSKKL